MVGKVLLKIEHSMIPCTLLKMDTFASHPETKKKKENRKRIRGKKGSKWAHGQPREKRHNKKGGRTVNICKSVRGGGEGERQIGGRKL